MWLHELSQIYDNRLIQEEFKGLRIDHPRITKGVSAPQLASPGHTYKNNKLGMTIPNNAAESLAGNVPFGNPYEQEEGVEDAPVSRNWLSGEIDKLMETLDESSPTDRVAMMVLAQLKQKI